jgi:hypothetical protein
MDPDPDWYSALKVGSGSRINESGSETLQKIAYKTLLKIIKYFKYNPYLLLISLETLVSGDLRPRKSLKMFKDTKNISPT